MATVKAHAGICGFETTIHADSEDGMTVAFRVESACPHIMKAAGELEPINAYEELFKKPADTSIYNTLAGHLPHTACPIYSAFFKAAEVAAGLALPADVSMHIEK